MEVFKNFKNYINPVASSVAAPDQEMSPESPKPENCYELRTINSRLHKSFNDSTKRISTLLKFRSVPGKVEDTQTLEPDLASTTNKPVRPKFLRSRSYYIRRNKNQTEDIINLNDQTAKSTNRDTLFSNISSNLEALISHFNEINSQDQVNDELDFMETTDQSARTYFKLCVHAKETFEKSMVIYRSIEANMEKFDIEPQIKANGYRSILHVFDSCLQRLLVVLNDLNERKKKFYFQFSLNNPNIPSTFKNVNVIKDLQTWVRLMEKMEIFLQLSHEMMENNLQEFEKKFKKSNDAIIPMKEFYQGPSLFVNLNKSNLKSMEKKLFDLSSKHQEAFFGRACGFQFCESLQRPLTGCAIALTSYNDGFEAFSNKENNIVQSGPEQGSPQNLKRTVSAGSATVMTSYGSLTNSIGKAAMSVYSSTKYIMDPDLRAKKMSQIMRKANVDFCKAFWQLTETSIVQMGSSLVTPILPINLTKSIKLDQTLRLPKVQNSNLNTDENFDIKQEFVDILPPKGSEPTDTVRIRILSAQVREGMLDSISPVSAAPIEPSNNLILHVHGGGFIAHSSKSHEIYLKPWCKELKVPIVSIDYSLAPEHVFPRASEECFYVYAWCLLNKNLLGWTGKNIICVGDSAGGVLSTNIVQRAIVNQIRIPDALVPIYSPFLLTYSISPSRLMSIMDPLLNLGILWRCLAAYSGIDFKAETERYKIMLNLEEVKQAEDKISSVKFSKSNSIESQEAIKIGENENVKINLKELNDCIELADIQPEFEADKLLSNEELLSYYELMGDAIFLIDKLRSNKVPYDHYMSPILSSDEILVKFPKTFLISACLDPLHDDSIEFKRRLNSLSVPNGIEVIEGVHHGFLNFVQISKECRKASKLVTSRIKSLIKACNDAFLDDALEMYRRMISLNPNVEILVVDNGSTHGFLNMQRLSFETHEAYRETLAYVKNIFDEFDKKTE